MRVPITDLLAGYTPPIIDNPLTYPDTGGTTEIPWYGTELTLQPLKPVESLANSLLAEPTGITTVTPQETVTVVENLGESLNVAFNPYVPGSPFTDTNLIGPLAYPFLALEPVLGFTAPDPDVALVERQDRPYPTVSVDVGHLFANPDAGKSDVSPNSVVALSSTPTQQNGSAPAAEVAGEGRHRQGIPVQKLLEKASGASGSGDTVTADTPTIKPFGKTLSSRLSKKATPPRGTVAGAVTSVSDRISSAVRGAGSTAKDAGDKTSTDAAE